jgi:putative transposase
MSKHSHNEDLPEIIIIDNDLEFIGNALDAWAYQRGVRLNFIWSGKPIENAYIESFNGKFRNECLKVLSALQVRNIIED